MNPCAIAKQLLLKTWPRRLPTLQDTPRFWPGWRAAFPPIRTMCQVTQDYLALYDAVTVA